MPMELVLLLTLSTGMAKVADSEGRSALLWGVLTLGIGMACLAIPMPYLRVLLAGALALVMMMIAKARGR